MVSVRIPDFHQVGLGGFCGALARFWVNGVFGAGFIPWGTFIANITGSFLFGFIQVLAVKGMSVGARFRLAAGIGFCGAYTTFSTFTKESLELLDNYQLLKGLFYILGTTGCCLVSVIAGIALGSLFCAFWKNMLPDKDGG